MKKALALLLALVMVLSLVACGAKEEAPAATEAPKAEAPAAPSPRTFWALLSPLKSRLCWTAGTSSMLWLPMPRQRATT